VKTSFLQVPSHTPARAKFPVIDARNHPWSNWDRAREIVRREIVRVLDEVGIVAYCDLTANARLEWREGGYRFGPAEIGGFFGEV